MTIKEKVICELYTGVCFVVGEERSEIYKYLSEKFNRPVFTHELADHKMQKEIKQRTRADFIKVCKGYFKE